LVWLEYGGMYFPGSVIYCYFCMQIFQLYIERKNASQPNAKVKIQLLLIQGTLLRK
jgi:hypothetical protein